MKKNKKIMYHRLFSRLMAVLLLFLVSAIVEIYPFGDKSVLTGDLNSIYVPEFSYIKDILDGIQDWGYSFQKNMGENTTGMFSYYVSSPFLVLLKFFSKSQLIYFGILLFYIKVVLATVFANIYINSRCDTDGILDIAAALGYGFMSYTMAYYQNIMWLDCVLLLPLILLSCDKIINGGKGYLYRFLLSLCIYCNFYIGFMCCIFIRLYFVWQYIEFNNYSIKNFKLKPVMTFAVQSVIGGLLPMFIIWPGIDYIFKCKTMGSVSNYTIDSNPLNIFKQFIIGSFDWGNVYSGLPFVFCGRVLTAGIFLYFTHEQISVKEKIGSFIVLSVIVLSFTNKFFNLIFHGMTRPVWFPHRHAFIFAIYAMVLFSRIVGKKLSKKQLIAFGIFIAALFVYWVLSYSKTISKKNMLFTVVIAGLIVLFWFANNHKKICGILALIVTMTELGINSRDILSKFELYSISDYKEQYSYMQQIKSVCDDDNNNGFYRMERTYFRTLNDRFLYGYNGLSHFDSTQDNIAGVLRASLGYAGNTRGDVNNPIGDCLAGVKYIVTKEPLDYSYTVKLNDNLYKNKYTIPFAMGIYKTDYDENSEKLEMYNQIFTAITGSQIKVAYSDNNFENLRFSDNCYVDIASLEYAVGVAKENAAEYEINGSKISIKYLNNNGMPYLMLDIPYNEDWQITLNGKKIDGENIFSGFMGIKLENGENNISLKFVPSGIKFGRGLTIFAILSECIFIFCNKKSKIKHE